MIEENRKIFLKDVKGQGVLFCALGYPAHKCVSHLLSCTLPHMPVVSTTLISLSWVCLPFVCQYLNARHPYFHLDYRNNIQTESVFCFVALNLPMLPYLSIRSLLYCQRSAFKTELTSFYIALSWTVHSLTTFQNNPSYRAFRHLLILINLPYFFRSLHLVLSYFFARNHHPSPPSHRDSAQAFSNLRSLSGHLPPTLASWCC